MKYQIDGIPIGLDSFAAKLFGSWFATTPSGFLIQAGVLNNVKTTEIFFNAIQEMHSKFKQKNPQLNTSLRLMCNLVCLQKEEWDLITAQDNLMAWFESQKRFPGQYGLLNLPIEHFYLPKNQPPESEFFLKSASKLSDLLNVKGWEMYCKWINEEIVLILQHIPLESSDSYTLEAYFKNFNHEIDSQLLKNLENEVLETQLKIGGDFQLFKHLQDTPETMINLEKKLIKARSEIRRLLKFQYDTMVEIERIISIIEDSHSGYVPLKHKCTIITHLIKNHLEMPEAKSPGWPQEFMLLQLLNEELGVLTVINGSQGVDRTSLAFAVMLTTSILKQKNSLEILIPFVLNWYQIAKEINKRIAHSGNEKFSLWISSANKDEEEASLKRNGKLMIKFRLIFYEILEKICIPIIKQTGKVKDVAWSETQKLSGDLFLLLPVYKDSKTKLVFLDGEGNATGLTTAGHFLMTQLFMT